MRICRLSHCGDFLQRARDSADNTFVPDFTSNTAGLVSPTLDRREMLARSCVGFGIVGLAGLIGRQSTALAASAGVKQLPSASSGSVAVRPSPHFAPRA